MMMPLFYFSKRVKRCLTKKFNNNIKKNEQNKYKPNKRVLLNQNPMV